jgi:hypothetical protein
MLEVLSLVFGGVLRLVPEWFKLWDKQKERDHERVMFDMQLEADKLRSKLRIDEVREATEAATAAGELAAMQEAFRSQAVPTGFPFLDWLNSSVRPILTYWWCIVLYTGYKILLMDAALKSGATLEVMAKTIMTDFDLAVMASIVGFWFVDRSIRKFRG